MHIDGCPKLFKHAPITKSRVLGKYERVNAPLLHKVRRQVGVEANVKGTDIGKRLNEVSIRGTLDNDEQRSMSEVGKRALKGNSLSCHTDPCTRTAATRAQSGDFVGGGLSVTWYTTGLARPKRRRISIM